MKIRFSKSVFPIFLPLLPVFFTGCATSPKQSQHPVPLPAMESVEHPVPLRPMEDSQPPVSRAAIIEPKKKKDSFAGFPEAYRLKARGDEEKGDLPKALRGWEVVKSFLPADAEAGGKIAQLGKQISSSAEEHFQKGVALFRSHSLASARKEFLLSLYLKPDHEEAIQYLKQKLSGEDLLTYEAKGGDTLQEVARKIYGDPQKDFLIAYFNGLKTNDRLEAPMLLKMPLLAPAPAKKASIRPKMAAEPISEIAVDSREILGKARTAQQKGNYQESAALMERILEYDPANREMHKLMNDSYYQLGKQLGQERKYQEALEAFHHVDPGYKDVNIQLAHNRKQLAEAHYIKGLKFFIEEDIENAIQEWKATLSLEPNHPKAKKDLENAQNLLKKLEKIN